MVLWEAIPGFFVYLQVFFTVVQMLMMRSSSQFILLRNGEDDLSFKNYASTCM